MKTPQTLKGWAPNPDRHSCTETLLLLTHVHLQGKRGQRLVVDNTAGFEIVCGGVEAVAAPAPCPTPALDPAPPAPRGVGTEKKRRQAGQAGAGDNEGRGPGRGRGRGQREDSDGTGEEPGPGPATADSVERGGGSSRGAGNAGGISAKLGRQQQRRQQQQSQPAAQLKARPTIQKRGGGRGGQGGQEGQGGGPSPGVRCHMALHSWSGAGMGARTPAGRGVRADGHSLSRARQVGMQGQGGRQRHRQLGKRGARAGEGLHGGVEAQIGQGGAEVNIS